MVCSRSGPNKFEPATLSVSRVVRNPDGIEQSNSQEAGYQVLNGALSGEAVAVFVPLLNKREILSRGRGKTADIWRAGIYLT